MDIGHLHHILNHLLPAGLLFSLILLITGMALKNSTLKKTSLWAFFLLAVMVIPTYLTGEPAEEIVAGIPWVPSHAVEIHEDFALWGLISVMLLGLISLAGLMVYRKPVALSQVFILSVLILSLFAGGVMTRTAVLGAQIRHGEPIRGEVAASYR